MGRTGLVRRQTAELWRSVAIVPQEPPDSRLSAQGRPGVVEPLDHGRERLGFGRLRMEVDGMAPGVLHNGARVLADGVGGQILPFKTTGMEHRDTGAASPEGSIGCPDIRRCAELSSIVELHA